jgi:hypothetical protein
MRRTKAQRQELYSKQQAQALKALDTLRHRILAHGADAADNGYMYGYHSTLDRLTHDIDALLTRIDM